MFSNTAIMVEVMRYSEAKFRTKVFEEERGTEDYVRNNLGIRIQMMSHDIMMH